MEKSEKFGKKTNHGTSRTATGLLALLTLLAALPLEARASMNNEVPRVVVNILIDQLRSDYLQAFMPLYGEDGFKKLLSEGRVYTQAEYPMTSPDRASAAATICTGTSPSNHGIVGLNYLDRETLRPAFCIDDEAFEGINATKGTSPARMMVSTIGDELKVATEGKSQVYAIAPFSDAAVLSGGHGANAVVWIDEQTGKWATSSYYGSLPLWANVRNQYYPLEELLNTVTWEPSSDLVGNFSYFLSGGMREPFVHKFKGDTRFRDFKTSGLVNEEVAAMAASLLSNTTIGNDALTDYLAVTFYAGNHLHQAAEAAPMEMQDIYVRLDKAIAQLIESVTQKTGINKTLFVLTSTGCIDEESCDPAKYRIPTGQFDMSRAASLLNMYLVAVYGQGQYVETCYGQQIYFNHKLIEDKQLNIVEVMERTQDFLVQLSGVKDVYTSQRLLVGAWTPGISRRRNGYNVRYSGDVMIEIAPGWRCVNSNGGSSKIARESYLPFPIIFYGCDTKAAVIESPVSVDRIAPTLASTMRIRAPNACANAPLILK